MLIDNGVLTDYNVSSDEAASGQLQRMKLAYSADGSDVHVGADANGLDVDIVRQPSASSFNVINGVSQVVTLDAGTCTSASIFCYGTFSGINLAFEISPDNSQWFSCQGQKVADGAISATSGVMSTSLPAWDLPLHGARYIRVRCTAYTSGTVYVYIISSMGSDPISTNIPSGVQAITPKVASNVALSNVTASITSVVLLANNPTRLGAVLHNDSTAILYLKYSVTASNTSYTYKIGPDDHWEMPDNLCWTGSIAGIWTAATGTARITELY